jgi:hypothetical protein
MANVRKVLICSDANRAALAVVLAAAPGGGIQNLAVPLSTNPPNDETVNGPTTWWGGSGWYPEEMITLLQTVPLLCEMYDTNGTAATFNGILASHVPVLHRVIDPNG